MIPARVARMRMYLRENVERIYLSSLVSSLSNDCIITNHPRDYEKLNWVFSRVCLWLWLDVASLTWV